MPDLHIAQDVRADQLLSQDPLALLLGMALDQQIPMEKAFRGPHVLLERLGALDAETIASYDPQEFAALVGRPPAVHRFPGSMAKRLQDLCAALVERYDGRAEAVWEGVEDGAGLLRRLEALPGFGRQKAQIFLALLGKQLGVRPAGWREAAGTYGEDGALRSVADVTGPDSLLEVRAYKQQQKRAAEQQRAGSVPPGDDQTPVRPPRAG